MKKLAAAPIDILLVEDDEDDIRLTREAFKENKLANNLYTVTDGEDAMTFLRREGGYRNTVRPDLILLDLNLPKMNGREVLAEIKNDPSLKSIPVVILTSSQSEIDITKSYNLHANAYITKPTDLSQLTNTVKSIEEFWFVIVKLPSRSQCT